MLSDELRAASFELRVGGGFDYSGGLVNSGGMATGGKLQAAGGG